MVVLRHHGEPDAVVLTPDGTIEAAEVPGLLTAASRLLNDQAATTVVLDLALLRHPGLATVDALVRLHLLVRRRRRPLLVRHVPIPLERVLELAGLSEALPPRGACRCRLCGG